MAFKLTDDQRIICELARDQLFTALPARYVPRFIGETADDIRANCPELTIEAINAHMGSSPTSYLQLLMFRAALLDLESPL